MSASALAPPRRLDLLMPDGLWYRSIEAYNDDEHFLEPMLSNHGTFIACNEPSATGGHYEDEIFVRGSNVQALRWVEP